MEKYGQDAHESQKTRINKLLFLIPIGIFVVVLTTLIAVKNHSEFPTASSGKTDTDLAEYVSSTSDPETALSTLAYVASTESFANESKETYENTMEAWNAAKSTQAPAWALIGQITETETTARTTKPVTQTAARTTRTYPATSRADYTTKATETRTTMREPNTSSYSVFTPRTSATTRAAWIYTSAPTIVYYTTKATTTAFVPRETNPPTTQPKTNSTTAKAHQVNLYFAAEKVSNAENNRAKLNVSYRIDSNYKLNDFILHYHTSTDSTERWTIRMTNDCKGKYYSAESRNHEVTIIANPGDTVYLTFEAVDVDGTSASKNAIVYI